MRGLVSVVAIVVCGFHLSSAVLAEDAASSEIPNLVTGNLNTQKPTTTVHVSSTTKPTTTAHVTNTTKPTTTVHVTNTTAHVTNTTKPTTTVHVTNTTVHLTNTTKLTTTAHASTTVLPTLTPNFSLPETGHYNVSLKNTVCVKAAIGIQLIVKQKAKDLYFNIPPTKTAASGKCGNAASWIILKFNSGFVNFTFVKDGKQYYIREISVALNVLNNLETFYHGTMNHMKLFTTKIGHSYKCISKQTLAFATNSLQILMVNTQLQAFDIPDGKFGQAGKCEADAESKVIPVLVGIALAALILTVVTMYILDRRRTSKGHEAVKVDKCSLDCRFIMPILFGVSLFVLIAAIVIVYLICRHRRFMGYQRI